MAPGVLLPAERFEAARAPRVADAQVHGVHVASDVLHARESFRTRRAWYTWSRAMFRLKAERNTSDIAPTHNRMIGLFTHLTCRVTNEELFAEDTDRAGNVAAHGLSIR